MEGVDGGISGWRGLMVALVEGGGDGGISGWRGVMVALVDGGG